MQALVLVAAIVGAPWATAPNPCTNGSFEELAPSGFPLDWEPVGQIVEAVSDAHTGQRALRLFRGEDALKGGLQTSETGLNRAWKAKSGERGAMIACLKGGIEFWYKALSAAEGTRLTVQAIPMNALPLEQTDSSRAIFTVPKDHIGDGQWHQGRLKYDFTGDPKTKWVHFGARILGPAGDLLLDDFAYVETVGPLLRISRLRLDEDPKRPGERCTISALIENVGDAPAPDVRATLTAPPGLRGIPAELRVGDLAPDSKTEVKLVADGRRERNGTLRLRAASAAAQTSGEIPLVTRMQIGNFSADPPAGIGGRAMVLACDVRNAGNTVLLDTSVELDVTHVALAKRTFGYIPPGRTRTVQAVFRPPDYDWSYVANVIARASNGEGQEYGQLYFDVGSQMRLPAPSGHLRAVANERYALLENEHIRLVFRRVNSEFGKAPGELQSRTPAGWRTVAWLPRLGAWRGKDMPDTESGTFRGSDGEITASPRVESGDQAAIVFNRKGTLSETTVRFSLSQGAKAIEADYQLRRDKPLGVEWLDGAMVYAINRQEALFPGLEWLVGPERASSALDIAESHPDRIRWVVHPNEVTAQAIGFHGRHGTVGLLWDPHQKWDGQRDRPSARFESPAERELFRCHLAGLFLPSVPEFVDLNTVHAQRPYPLQPGHVLRLHCRIFADGEAKDALAAVDEWIRIYGLPEPQPLPRRPDPSDRSNQSNQSSESYEREIQFSMQAYLKSLWVPETKEWWTSKGGGPIMSKKGRPHNFVADLLLGSLVSPDETVRRQCRERAEAVSHLAKCETRLDALRFPGRFDLAIANPAHAAGLLATMGDDGAWRFDADQEGKGPFVGMDYHELGPDNAVEVGTCANKAFQVLRYARIAGDAEAYERMQKTLRLMETFRVPRAAQVWEVPVHTPDLLAAADAVDAYLEAYRFSGDERWLRDAVTWARRGIPFIYLWNPADKPWLLGASIPVYGASWFTCSWFGRPVQWNGLRYAAAILKLAEHDRSKDWRRLAELIIRSAILQQEPDGENVALWPDNISAIDGKKCPWVFAPRQIIQNILLLNGRDEEPRTTILSHKPFLAPTRRIHISATAKVTDAAWDGDLLAFKAAYPQGEEGCVLIANVAKPTSVTLDGKPLAERSEVEKGAEPGWRYDDALAYLCIRIGPPAPLSVMLSEAKHLSGEATDTTKASPAGGANSSTPVMLSEAKHLSGQATDTTGASPASGARSPERFFAPLRSAQNDSGVGAAQNDSTGGAPSEGYGLKAALQTRAVRVEGARFRRVDRLPTLAEGLDFSFARSAEGWMAAHDIADLAVRSGALCGTATANDPYIVRSLVRIKGDDCPLLLIRMRSTAGPAAQLFWTTEASPAFGEEKSLRFQVRPDGQWHDYRLEPGKHPQWAGQTITALRLDPGNAPGEFGIALIRGAARK